MLINSYRFAGPTGPLVEDSFNRTAGALGTADVGGSWTTSNWETNGTKAFPAATGATFASIDCGETDVIVSAVISTRPSSTNWWMVSGIAARATDINNCYFTAHNYLGNTWLYKRVAGVNTALGGGQWGSNVAAGSTIELRCIGTSISLWVNGVSALSATDSSLTGTGAGFRADTSDTASRFDDFIVELA